MAASRSDRVYHQDYIARIRYSNTLPPPPCPPKLLDIPDTSLSGGLYTSPSFAARLHREQPLNIEADAELGMPINLIGLPGVFDGDESVIHGLDNPPPPHPRDKPLLRPLAMLGKGSHAAGVSFLRRTEYISADAQQRIEPSKSRLKMDPRKRKRPEYEKEDPRRMIEDIVKGFNLAYPQDKHPELGHQISAEEQRAWDHPRHPTDPSLKVLDAYPLLPDLDALGDAGAYIVTKFVTNPTAATDVYDTRLDVGLLRPLEASAEDNEQREALQRAHEADPENVPKPPPQEYDFEYFLPTDDAASLAIKSRFDVNNPNNDEEGLYDQENPDTGKRYFRYQRVRAYETYKQKGNPSDPNDAYQDAVAIALHDGEEGGESNKRARLQKGAYFYPIMQQTTIRPKRHAAASLTEDGEQSRVDVIEVVVRAPDEGEEAARQEQRRNWTEWSLPEGDGVNGNAEPEAVMPVAPAAAMPRVENDAVHSDRSEPAVQETQGGIDDNMEDRMDVDEQLATEAGCKEHQDNGPERKDSAIARDPHVATENSVTERTVISNSSDQPQQEAAQTPPRERSSSPSLFVSSRSASPEPPPQSDRSRSGSDIAIDTEPTPPPLDTTPTDISVSAEQAGLAEAGGPGSSPDDLSDDDMTEAMHHSLRPGTYTRHQLSSLDLGRSILEPQPQTTTPSPPNAVVPTTESVVDQARPTSTTSSSAHDKRASQSSPAPIRTTSPTDNESSSNSPSTSVTPSTNPEATISDTSAHHTTADNTPGPSSSTTATASAATPARPDQARYTFPPQQPQPAARRGVHNSANSSSRPGPAQRLSRVDNRGRRLYDNGRVLGGRLLEDEGDDKVSEKELRGLR